jgi:hypothetical protein
MVAGTVGAAAFVQALHEGCTGVTEYRIINADGAATKAFGDPEDVVRAHPDENVFVGVATRQDRSSGTLENCQHLPALFCDIDYKVTPEASALQRLEHFPLAPSIIVASGGGVHVYWMLREPFDLTVEAERDQARALLRRLALELGGDVAAGECARVLRVPGSWNVKPEYGTPRPVVVQHFDPDRRYNPSELDEVLLPEITPAGAGPSAPFILPATIPESAPGRNPTLFRYGRSLKASGVKPLRIIEALHQVNRERCIPPLAPDEMDTIVNSVLGTADRPSFTQNGHPERPAPATAPSIEIIDAADLVVREFPEEQALVGGGLIVPRALVVNGGAPKRGKSLLVLNREICRALGRPFLGFPTTPGRTLYLQAEIPEPQLKARLVLMLSSALDAGPIDGERLRGHLLTVTRRGLFLDESAG